MRVGLLYFWQLLTQNWVSLNRDKITGSRHRVIIRHPARSRVLCRNYHRNNRYCPIFWDAELSLAIYNINYFRIRL